MTLLLPLLLALVAAPATALAGLVRPRWAAPVAIAMAGLSFLATLWGWSMGGGSIDVPWAPTWDLRLSLTLDGLAAMYSLLATGIGLAVIVYSTGYMPPHLEHHGRPIRDVVSFYAFVLLFMGSMVGLSMAQDLLLIFVFWDLTAVASYFLIGYDREQAEARSAALTALLVTGTTAVLFLIGSLLLYSTYGTFSLPELIANVEPGPPLTVAAGLMAVAALAKSAQFPFHFWLPRAMAAPTPVSAYLHSAAMVAAGVFLLGRIYPLLATSDLLLDVLLVVGLVSMAVGGVLALSRDVLKQLLAYSTIAQYGYVVTMLGLGGTYGVLGATFYVLAHAIAKSALFLTAGAVTTATGEDRFSRLGGLRRHLPVLAVVSGISAAALAGLPLTIGFFKDELFFAATLRRGTPFPALAVAAAALTLAYSWRFWSGLFLGPVRSSPEPISPRLTGPIVALALLAVLGSFVVEPFAALAEAAGRVSLAGAEATITLAYHFDDRPENLMALATYTVGVLVILTRTVWSGAASAAARLGDRVGPERSFHASLSGLGRLSSYLHNNEVRDLRERVATVLIPTALLVGVGLLATPFQDAFVVGPIAWDDLPLALALAISSAAAIAAAMVGGNLAIVLLLSGVGYSLVVVYALFGAPDVALVAVLVETIFSLLLLGMLALFPAGPRTVSKAPPTDRVKPWRDPILTLGAGAVALVATWGALSQPAEGSVGSAYIALTPLVHAGDVVTAILADFRGLDTAGEITVIAISLIGVTALLSRVAGLQDDRQAGTGMPGRGAAVPAGKGPDEENTAADAGQNDSHQGERSDREVMS